MVGDQSFRNAVGPYREEEIRRVKCSLIFVKEMDMISLTHGLKSLREDCKPGKHQDIEINIVITRHNVVFGRIISALLRNTQWDISQQKKTSFGLYACEI